MPTPILRTDDKGNWYAYWSEGRRSKRKSMGTKNHSDAETYFAQWLLFGGHKGEVSENGKAALTVAELWSVYNEKHVQRETSAPASIEYAWKNLAVHFGLLRLDQIDQDTVDDYEDLRLAGKIGRVSKPSTVRKELVALRACFNWHASPERGKRRLLETKDLPVYVLPEEGRARDRWLTMAEIDRVLKAAASLHPGETRMSRGERFVWLALETAARKQAILDLTWDRVDFEIGTIDFSDPDRKETKKRRVVVPISRALKPVLERMHKERINGNVMDSGAEIWATVQSIVIRAGLSPKQKVSTGDKPTRTGISPHTFRHTAATQMARRGVPLYHIAGVLGNSVAMVERVYAKHAPGALRDAVNAMYSERDDVCSPYHTKQTDTFIAPEREEHHRTEVRPPDSP